MTPVIRRLRRIVDQIANIPPNIRIVVGGVGLISAYALVFLMPTTVALEYKQATCVQRLTFFPEIERAAGESDYKITFKDFVMLGSLKIASRSVCVQPVEPPKQGTAVLASAPGGGLVARQHFKVVVPPAPVADVAAINDAPIPATKPLTVALSKPDSLFSYRLEVGKKEAACKPVKQSVSCALDTLGLSQGKDYSFRLMRTFASRSPVAAATGTLTTLKAVTIKQASLTQNQTVYNKPKQFRLTTDKPLQHAEATLINTKTKKPFPVTTTVDDKTITVSLGQELARKTPYRLTLTKVEATDSSTLVGVYSRQFTTSGGPAVTSISIGSSKVNPVGQIVLSLDQPLATGTNLASFISLSGVAATVSSLNKTQVAITPHGLGRCQAFTVNVKAGMKNTYGVTATENWSYRARTVCHTTSVYGYSLQGRALVAYHYGSSGPVTMYVGAIHGNESSSSVLMQAWIDELEAYPDRWKGKRIVVVPTINPDGVAAGTRTNSRGVNLNRNFPTDNWVSDIDDTDGRHKGGGGSKPLSEPEAKALASLTSQLHPRLLLSFHAVGSLVVGDPGGYSATYAAKYANLTGYRNATGQSSTTFDYSITGSYEDWTYRNVGIPSMVIELSSYGYANIWAHQAALWAML